MNNPFKIDVDLPRGDEIAGKVRLAFTVPYMWFAFYRPMGVLGPLKLDKNEQQRAKEDVCRKFATMIAEEMMRCWPEDKELEK